MNPWEQILKNAVGSAILVELPAFEAHKADILAAAAKLEISCYNVAEKYIDAQIESAQMPPVLGLFREQLIGAVNTEIGKLRSGVQSDNDMLFTLLVAWAKQEATNLGA